MTTHALARALLIAMLAATPAGASGKGAGAESPAALGGAECDLGGAKSVSQALAPAFAIPDDNRAFARVGVLSTEANGNTLGGVTLEVSIAHTWTGDLEIRLEYVDCGSGVLLHAADIVCRPRGTNLLAPAPCGAGTSAGCGGNLGSSAASTPPPAPASYFFFSDSSAVLLGDGSCPALAGPGCCLPATPGAFAGFRVGAGDGIAPDGRRSRHFELARRGPSSETRDRSPSEAPFMSITLPRACRRIGRGLVVLLFAGLGSRPAPALEAPPAHLLTIGSLGSAPGQFALPHGLSADTHGRLYVADYGNSRISVFGYDGTLLGQWGTRGTGPGQLDGPWNVLAAPSGSVFVADRDGHRVQKFTPDGAFLMGFGSPGDGAGQFNRPYGLAEDAQGNLYVTDEGFNDIGRVQKFSATGQYVATRYSGPMPRAIALNGSQTLFVLEGGRNQVELFSTSPFFGSRGAWGGIITSGCCPYGITVDAFGNILVADTQSNNIKKFSPSGTLLAHWSEYVSASGPTGTFHLPHGLAVDPLGDLYVADALNSRVQKFSGTATIPVAAHGMSWGRLKRLYRSLP